MLPLDKSLWKVIGQGGANVVFAFLGTNEESSDQSDMNGKVIRLQKKRDPDFPAPSSSDTVAYYKELVSEFLGSKYAVDMEWLPLSRIELNFFNSLYDPSGKDSLREDDGAILMPNLTGPGFISIEIKPKWGFTYEIFEKVKRCRYCLHQVFKDNQQSISSSSIQLSISKFCPLDLYSNDLNRIISSLHRLIESPRNNLKLWVHGKVHRNVKEFLVPLIEPIARILYHDPILQKLKSAQMRLDQFEIEHIHNLYKSDPERASQNSSLIDYCKSVSFKDCSIMLKIPYDSMATNFEDVIIKVIDLDIKHVNKVKKHHELHLEMLKLTSHNPNYYNNSNHCSLSRFA